jgi:LPS sulfotransferase NodH
MKIFNANSMTNAKEELGTVKANLQLLNYYLRGLSIRNTIHPFIIFGLMRSGTTFFGDLLGQHPDLTWLGETFVQRAYYPALYLSGLAAATGVARPGLKIFSFQLSRKMEVPPRGYSRSDIGRGRRILSSLAARNWKFIHLSRTDIFAQCASFTRAAKTGFWHARSELEEAANLPVQLDLSDFERHLKAFLTFRSYEAKLFSEIEVLRLDYETDLEDLQAQQAAVDRAFRFLGVPNNSVSSRYVKLGAPDLSIQIENYEEIARIVERFGVSAV